MLKTLINAATVTDATKVEFNLTSDDFIAYPTLRGSGFLTGDSSKLWFMVNGTWVDSGLVLSDTVSFLELPSLGHYAIDVTIALVSTISVDLQSSGRQE
jgi:hypothetical protein